MGALGATRAPLVRVRAYSLLTDASRLKVGVRGLVLRCVLSQGHLDESKNGLALGVITVKTRTACVAELLF